jgi:hypothetical protein
MIVRRVGSVEIVLVLFDHIDRCRPEIQLLAADVALGQLTKSERRLLIDVRLGWTLSEAMSENLSRIISARYCRCTNMETVVIHRLIARCIGQMEIDLKGSSARRDGDQIAKKEDFVHFHHDEVAKVRD